MKVTFKKSWENFPGHTIPAGATADVAKPVAMRLMEKDIVHDNRRTPFPDDLPGKHYLLRAGYHFLQELPGDLTQINGIGKITAKKIEQIKKQILT